MQAALNSCAVQSAVCE